MHITLPPHIIVPHPDAYLVGGSVRDLIRGVVPLDYDIAVLREPAKYAARLAKQLGRRVIQIGKPPFTVYRVISDTIQVDVVPINGSGIEADLETRDFTVNALACEIPSGRMIDTTNGLRDMENDTLRMVSAHAFIADPIRLLRAFRMAAVMNFDIEPLTLEAISRSAARIQESAGERILNELHKTLACDHSHRQIINMAKAGLLFAIFPELIPMAACGQNRHHAENAFAHTLNAYQALEGILARPRKLLSETAVQYVHSLDVHSKILLKLAILLHDIGKPDTRIEDTAGEPHFHGHAKKSVDLLRPVCRRLRMSNHDHDWIVFLTMHHQRPLDLYLAANQKPGQSPPKAVGRFFRQCGEYAPALLVHALADNLGKIEHGRSQTNPMHLFIVDLLSTCLDVVRNRHANPLINGHDLIRHFDLSPSPRLGTILKQVEEAHLAGMIQNRDQALEWVSNQLREIES